MDTAILVLVGLVLLSLVAERLAGPESKLRAKWDEYSDRELSGQTNGANGQPDKPVTKQYLMRMIAFDAVVLAFYSWFGATDNGWTQQDAISTLLFFLLLVLPGMVRMIREYRKPGHGSRYRQRPMRNSEPDPDGW